MKQPSKKTLLASLIASGLGVGLPAMAADESGATPPAAAAQPAEGLEKQERIVITGSAVPTTRDAAAVSVAEVDQEKIQKSGASSDMLDLLRKAVPTFQGRGNTGSTNANNTNQNTAGGSQVQLKNMDTLVLVNGRRVAISGIAAIGGKAFVNASQIPTSAIERIEIISDGSSAIYGSDAIGGVVNIILKSNYNGVEAGARVGSANNYTEHSAYFTAGTAVDKFSLTVSGNFSHTDPLYQRDRSFSSPITGRVSVVPGTIGGGSPAILATALNTPSASNPTGANATAPNLAALIANGTYVASTNPAIASSYDISQFQTLALKQDQTAFAANAKLDLLDNRRLVAFSDLQVAQNKSFTQFLPITTTVNVPQGAPSNPLASNFASVNFADWNAPKQYHNDQKSLRLTAGLRGDLGDGWSWESAFVHSRNTLQQLQGNVLFKPNIALAIAGGYDSSGNAVAGGNYSRVYSGFSTSKPFVFQPALDPFARAAALAPASLANVYGTEVIDTASQLDSFDASLTGTLGRLPAGKVAFAVGLASRREKLEAHTDENGHNTGPGAQQWLGGTSADAFAKSRTVNAVFAEVRVPITSAKMAVPALNALDLITAVRAENYSDAGKSTVPKIGFRWQPVGPSLTIRGSYSRSFTAPTMYAEYGPTGTRLVGSGVIQTVFGLANPGLQGEDGNNPNLQPSKAKTQSLNFVYRPADIDGLSLSLEYSAVDQKGFPGGVGFTNILQSVDQAGSASPFAGNLAKGNFPGLPGATPFANPGDLSAYLKADPNNSLNVYAIDRFMNLGGVKVKAFNASAEYEMDLNESGVLTIGSVGTIFKSYQFQALPYQKYYEYAGYATNGGTGVQGTLPKYRFYTTLDWQIGNWSATLGNTYVSAVTDIGAGGIVYETSTTLKPKHVSAYTTWDLRLGYKHEGHGGSMLKGWNLALGVNNIGNRMPPASPQAFTDNLADVATFSPIGRLLYVTGKASF
ncbi:TonB-dependent receptor plug domain-containing protein [Roseateles sp. BYS78W]|uniref:TonB-dependent receptor plug domain-containing protein n=1 Tax=Pelomonas candidula TaxID=3299025 RepID=A0ABW7HKJ8_9BURK